MNRELPGMLQCLLAVAMLLVAPACGRTTGKERIKDLTQKAAELDQLTRKVDQAAAVESRDLTQGKLDEVLDPATLQLTDPQKAALEARIKAEKDFSFQSLLQEVLDKDQEIKALNVRIAQLRADLPRPQIAGANDSHYGMAMNFLRGKGVPEAQAKQMVSRVLILDRMAPGFEVYHFYGNGVYGTWVAQGRAEMTPTRLQADQKAALEGERDQANERRQELQEQVAKLTAEAERIVAEIDVLRIEKARMTKEVDDLAAANEVQKATLNSVHYLVGARRALEQEGVIVVPVFARDRAGANWNDQVFTRSADLRREDSITLTAAQAGLDRIGKVEVVPGSLEKDKHYVLDFNPDRTAATVKILAKERFRNEKVVFALAE
ncbi:MAG: hypothetical protein P4L36_13235 [Holophaga sp.]|nr:hypothetical protein [Holophaga sp.]